MSNNQKEFEIKYFIRNSNTQSLPYRSVQGEDRFEKLQDLYNTVNTWDWVNNSGTFRTTICYYKGDWYALAPVSDHPMVQLVYEKASHSYALLRFDDEIHFINIRFFLRWLDPNLNSGSRSSYLDYKEIYDEMNGTPPERPPTENIFAALETDWKRPEEEEQQHEIEDI
jgi:hypothetical protein